MRALITAEFTDEGVRRLQQLGYQVERAGWGVTRQPLEPGAYARDASTAALLITEIERVDGSVLDAAPGLQLVATARGAPVNVDLTACERRGIPVVFTPARNADSVADFTVGLVLSLVRGISESERHLRDQGWDVDGELPYLHFRGPELADRTLGVVGYGATGSRVAQRLRDGFGMRVLFSDPHVQGGVPLELLLARADVVSVHAPRGLGTRGLVDPRRMRPGAWLVNTAGGGVVDETALLEALHGGHLSGAALDVFSTEPLPRDSPLLAAPRLLLTPHLAGAADDVVRHHTDLICTDVERWHRGETLRHPALRTSDGG